MSPAFFHESRLDTRGDFDQALRVRTAFLDARLQPTLVLGRHIVTPGTDARARSSHLRLYAGSCPAQCLEPAEAGCRTSTRHG